MKKTIMFLGVLSLGLAQAQQEFEGKVGVNTETPTATLNVKSKTGNVGGTNFQLESPDGTKMVTVLDNGKVGINNANPEYILDIKAYDFGYGNNSIALRASRSGIGSSGIDMYRSSGTVDNPQAIAVGDALGGLTTYAYAGVDTKYQLATSIYSRATAPVTAGHYGTSILFKTYGEDTNVHKRSLYNPEMTIYHTGNVGIGTGSTQGSLVVIEPLEKLHIVGAIKVGSSYNSSTITHGATTPIPKGNIGTIVYQNGHFYGWTADNAWKQLDNVESTNTGATQLSGTDNIECKEENRGKMNFKRAEDGKSDVFGVCLKNANGNYNWAYFVGGGNPTNGSGVFGNGIVD